MACARSYKDLNMRAEETVLSLWKRIRYRFQFCVCKLVSKNIAFCRRLKSLKKNCADSLGRLRYYNTMSKKEIKKLSWQDSSSSRKNLREVPELSIPQLWAHLDLVAAVIPLVVPDYCINIQGNFCH